MTIRMMHSLPIHVGRQITLAWYPSATVSRQARIRVGVAVIAYNHTGLDAPEVLAVVPLLALACEAVAARFHDAAKLAGEPDTNSILTDRRL